MMHYRFSPIGYIRSPFKEKFGIPRQPGLVPVEAELELVGRCARPEAVRGLEAFSHVWLQFVFHATAGRGWKPTVRPPRLGGNARVGVFATRSTFRPNPLGLSVVELVGIEAAPGRVVLRLRGADLLDGTPVLDVKPYLPYADSLPGARTGFAPEVPPSEYAVVFAPEVAAMLATRPTLRALLEKLLATDPRPAYRGGSGRFGLKLYDVDVRCELDEAAATIRVTAIVPAADGGPKPGVHR